MQYWLGMSEISYKEKFEQFQHLMLAAFGTFYVWKSLQNEEYNDVYKMDGSFWSAVLPALQHEWFIGLARLFEESRYSSEGRVISVYVLMREHPDSVRVKEVGEFLKRNGRVLNNIARIRDHRHAHNNAQFLISPKDFQKRFEIKYSELEEIFEFANKLLGILHPEDDHGYVLDHLKKEAQTHTEDIVRAVRHFFAERNEHRKKWAHGEVDDPDFPSKK